MESGAPPEFEFQGQGHMITLSFASKVRTFDDMLPYMLDFTCVDSTESTHAFGQQLPRSYGPMHAEVMYNTSKCSKIM